MLSLPEMTHFGISGNRHFSIFSEYLSMLVSVLDRLPLKFSSKPSTLTIKYLDASWDSFASSSLYEYSNVSCAGYNAIKTFGFLQAMAYPSLFEHIQDKLYCHLPVSPFHAVQPLGLHVFQFLLGFLWCVCRI